MSNNTCPNFNEVRIYLTDFNGWSDEEVDQLAGYAFRHISEDGTTNLTRDEWTAYVMAYCDEHIQF